MQELTLCCTHCGVTWKDLDRFLSDSSVNLCGYQVNFLRLEEGLFLFTHQCGTTFSYPARTFKSLYEGPVFQERLAGTEECLGYCTQREEFKICPLECECAWVSKVLHIIHGWAKTH